MRTIIFLSAVFAYFLWKVAGNPDFFQDTPSVGYHLVGTEIAGEIDGVALLVGELVVFFFYWFKFKEWAGEGDAPLGFRPRPVSHFTTWLRFLGWSSAYGLLMVGAFNLVVFFPELISRIIQSYVEASSDMQSPLGILSEAQSLNEAVFGPLPEQRLVGSEATNKLIPYAVILVTVIWAGVEPAASFERRFRRDLQRRAAIPTQASGLVQMLCSSRLRFAINGEVKRTAIRAAGGIIEEKDFRTDDAELDLWSLYARTEYLHEQLRDYRLKPIFAPLVSRYAPDYEALEQRIAKLRDALQQRLGEIRTELADRKQQAQPPETTLREADVLLEQLNKDSPNSLRLSHFNVQREELNKEINEIWKELLQLIVCSVLAVGRTSKHRQQLFDDFGLKLPPISAQLEWHTILNIGAVVVAIVFLTSVAYKLMEPELSGKLPPYVPKSNLDVAWWAFVTMLMHLLGAIGGYATQRSLEAQRERMFLGDPRLAGISERSAEVVLAGVAGVVLNIYLLAFILASSGRFSDLVGGWWWALIPGVTAMFTAIYAQMESQRRLDHEFTIYQARRGALQLLWIQALVTSFVAIGIALMLQYDSLAAINQMEGKMRLYVAYVMVTGASIGLGFGWVLRHWAAAQANEMIRQHEQSYLLDHENRRGERRPIRATADWKTEKKSQKVKVFSISQNGAAVYSKQQLEVDSEGTITIAGAKSRKARVMRGDPNNRGCFYLRYEKSEAA